MTLTGSKEKPRCKLERGEEKIGKTRFRLDGTEVTLTAVADPHSDFIGWSGDASGGTNPITVTVDADKAVSTYADGVLTVTMPKKEAAASKKISVNIT